METGAEYNQNELMFDLDWSAFMGTDEYVQPLTGLVEGGDISTVEEINDQFALELNENFNSGLPMWPPTENIAIPSWEIPMEPFPPQSIEIGTLHDQQDSTVVTVATNIPNPDVAPTDVTEKSKPSKLAAKKSSGGGRKMHLYEKDPALETDEKERKKIVRAIRMKMFHEKRKALSKINVTRMLETKAVLTTIVNESKNVPSGKFDLSNLQNAMQMFRTLNPEA